jgi:YesN/AraC family two-component response regulator
MQYASFVFYSDLPVHAGWGGLLVSNGNYDLDRAIEEHELVFVQEGHLRVDEWNQSFDVTANQSIILVPGVQHRCYKVGDEPLKHYWVRFAHRKVIREAGSKRINAPRIATIARSERMVELFRKFFDEQEAGFSSQITADLLVMLMLCEIAQSPTATGENGNTLGVLASQARLYIQQHYAQPISTSDVAYALDCNPKYLGRAFRKAYGKTTTDYIYDVRLHYARMELVNGRKSIAEIAGCCGFADPCYFRRIFVKREGVSPIAYRRLFGRVTSDL